jgi:hypothetical protein
VRLRPHHRQILALICLVFLPFIPAPWEKVGNRYSGFVPRELADCFFGEPDSVGRFSVERHPPAIVPAEDCFQLSCSQPSPRLLSSARERTVERQPRRRRDETIAEGLLGHGRAGRRANESQVARSCSLNDAPEFGQNRNRQLSVGLLRTHDDHAVGDVLAPESSRVPTSQSSVEQDRERQSLAGPDRPLRLELVGLRLRPGVESDGRAFDAFHVAGRVGCD